MFLDGFPCIFVTNMEGTRFDGVSLKPRSQSENGCCLSPHTNFVAGYPWERVHALSAFAPWSDIRGRKWHYSFRGAADLPPDSTTSHNQPHLPTTPLRLNPVSVKNPSHSTTNSNGISKNDKFLLFPILLLAFMALVFLQVLKWVTSQVLGSKWDLE